jgi:hypothetical protein
MTIPKIPEHKAQEEDPQYFFRQRRVKDEPTGPQDFKMDRKPREGVSWKKPDGHPSLFQEDPINELRVLSIEMKDHQHAVPSPDECLEDGGDGGAHWE